MLISAFPKASLTKKTMKQVFSLLAWSFEILFSGVIPKKDLFGNQMENYRGRRVRPGVLYSITGDLEWFCQEFDWPYPSSNQLCPYCSADAMRRGQAQFHRLSTQCFMERHNPLKFPAEEEVPEPSHFQSTFSQHSVGEAGLAPHS